MEDKTLKIYEHIKHICDDMSAEQIERAEAMLSDFIAHEEAEQKCKQLNSANEEEAEAIRNSFYYGCESDYIF